MIDRLNVQLVIVQGATVPSEMASKKEKGEQKGFGRIMEATVASFFHSKMLLMRSKKLYFTLPDLVFNLIMPFTHVTICSILSFTSFNHFNQALRRVAEEVVLSVVELGQAPTKLYSTTRNNVSKRILMNVSISEKLLLKVKLRSIECVSTNPIRN